MCNAPFNAKLNRSIPSAADKTCRPTVPFERDFSSLPVATSSLRCKEFSSKFVMETNKYKALFGKFMIDEA
jgi:hypothetical protein